MHTRDRPVASAIATSTQRPRCTHGGDEDGVHGEGDDEGEDQGEF